MPAVVSDAGPLIHLAQIGKLLLLGKLFGTVLITERVKIEVFDEGLRLGYKDADVIGIALKEGLLRVEEPPKRLAGSVLKLSQSENISKADAETLLLAVNKKAKLLVDERLLSSLAKMYGLHTYNTWTLLLEGLGKHFLELYEIEKAVDILGKKKFSLNAKQKQEILDSAKAINNQ